MKSLLTADMALLNEISANRSKMMRSTLESGTKQLNIQRFHDGVRVDNDFKKK
jgi:methionyl-tRNA synthetase